MLTEAQLSEIRARLHEGLLMPSDTDSSTLLKLQRLYADRDALLQEVEELRSHQHKHLWMIWQPSPEAPPVIVANSSCSICGLTPEAVANQATIQTLMAEVERLADQEASHYQVRT